MTKLRPGPPRPRSVPRRTNYPTQVAFGAFAAVVALGAAQCSIATGAPPAESPPVAHLAGDMPAPYDPVPTAAPAPVPSASPSSSGARARTSR